MTSFLSRASSAVVTTSALSASPRRGRASPTRTTCPSGSMSATHSGRPRETPLCAWTFSPRVYIFPHPSGFPWSKMGLRDHWRSTLASSTRLTSFPNCQLTTRLDTLASACGPSLRSKASIRNSPSFRAQAIFVPLERETSTDCLPVDWRSTRPSRQARSSLNFDRSGWKNPPPVKRPSCCTRCLTGQAAPGPTVLKSHQVHLS